MLITKNQAEKWFDNSVQKQFNPDLFYGFQCYDYANMFFMIATGKGYKVYTLIIFHLIIKQGLKNTGK